MSNPLPTHSGKKKGRPDTERPGSQWVSVDFAVVGVDDLVLALFLGLGLGAVATTLAAAGGGALVDVLPDLLERVVELVHRAPEPSHVGALGRRLESLHLGLDLGLDVGRDLVPVLLE